MIPLEDPPETVALAQKIAELELTIAELKKKIARQEKTLARSADILRALHQVNLLLGTTVHAHQLLEQVLQGAINLLNASKGGGIYLYDESLQKLVLAVQMGWDANSVVKTIVPGEGLAGQVFQTSAALVVRDYENWKERLNLSSDNSIGSALGVPLNIKKQVIGVLTLFTGSVARPFTRTDATIAEMFAAQAAVTIQSARALEQLENELAERKQMENRERELRALAQTMVDITILMNSSLDLENILNIALANIHRIAPFDAACLLLVSGGVAFSVRSKSDDPALAAFLEDWSVNYLDHPVFVHLALEQTALKFTNLEDSVNLYQPQFESLNAYLGAPIMIREELIGFILIGSKSLSSYNEEYVRRMQAFATQASLAINNARLYEEVQSLAITDPLTKVYNRRGFMRFGQQEINRAMRFGRPLSLLFFDIDHFKAFNDRYSYEIGDLVLEKVAEVTQATVRNVDLVARYGGEEFVILVPEVVRTGAVVVAERLRSRVESLRVTTAFGELGITISVGVASMNFPKFQTKPLDVSEIELLEQLIQKAGQVLRVAKDTGRNRVCVEEDDQGSSTEN